MLDFSPHAPTSPLPFYHSEESFYAPSFLQVRQDGNGMKYEHTIKFADLKEAYIRAVNGDRVCKRQRNQDQLKQLISGWQRRSSFYGPSSTEMKEWLSNGYKQPGLKLDDPPIERVRKRRRLQYSEEGELQLDLMWSGHDYPFLSWTKRETMPGMNIDILYNFQASTNVNVIIAYCRFILRSLIALEAAGIDLEVWISSDSTDIFQGSYADTLWNHIEVKREGEQTDYLGWSAMVSPGGFRHLMFLDYVLATDSVGKDVQGGLGRGTNGGQPWDIAYDSERRMLRFLCPWYPHTFPEEMMENKLREELANARKAA